MSETIEHLRHKISSARDLKSVVRTMKALAGASIGQYQRASTSLVDYYRTVELGLVACLRGEPEGPELVVTERETNGAVCAVVFGSDQGLVGQFNERLAEFARTELAAFPGDHKLAWAVGQRVRAALQQQAFPVPTTYPVPNSVTAITGLVTKILLDLELERENGRMQQLYLFHNRTVYGSVYETNVRRLLPFDQLWRHDLKKTKWPSRMVPEVLDGDGSALSALVREYLFVSLYQTCAESLASENACRLAAMQRAEKNINGMMEDLGHSFNQLRQAEIDEELFDLVSGYEALLIEESLTRRPADNPH